MFKKYSSTRVLVASLSLLSVSVVQAADKERTLSSKYERNSISHESSGEFEEENIRRANTLSVEILGRGLLYSINYDHQLSHVVALGAGFSYWSISSNSASANTSVNALVLPLYGNFYLAGDVNRFYLTAGADMVFATVNGKTSSDFVSGSGVGLLPTFGLGYELRTNGGFLLRVAPYLLATARNVQPFFGFSLGGAF